MMIGIVGAGRVGSSFALALHERGIGISGIYARSLEKKEFLSDVFGKEIFMDAERLVYISDVILLTVPDSEIATAANMLRQSFALSVGNSSKFIGNNSSKLNGNYNSKFNGKIVLHCSGALTSKELSVLADEGIHTGAFHPLQTFASPQNSYKSMFGIYFGYEGSERAYDAAGSIASAVDGKIFRITAEDKSLYHAAACVVSNYAVALAYMAEELLKNTSLEVNATITPFMPLMKTAVENIERLGVYKALTGPVSRGDMETVSRHIKAMEKNGPKLEKNSNSTEIGMICSLYKSLAAVTTDIALKNGSIGNEKAALLYKLAGLGQDKRLG